jgi:hypothetical protein
LDVEVGEEGEKNDGVGADPVDEYDRVVASYEQELGRVNHDSDELNLFIEK